MNRFGKSVFAFIVFLFPVFCYAHGDEDHGKDKPAAIRIASTSPRLEVTTPDLELVAVMRQGKLVMYLDRYASNDPLGNASIEVESGGHKAPAQPAGEGVYSVQADWLTKPGKHELVFTVRSENLDDLLVGILEVPAPEQRPDPNATGFKAPAWLWSSLGLLGLGGVALIFARRRRNKSMGAA